MPTAGTITSRGSPSPLAAPTPDPTPGPSAEAYMLEACAFEASLRATDTE
jgi:hypothetical protein